MDDGMGTGQNFPDANAAAKSFGAWELVTATITVGASTTGMVVRCVRDGANATPVLNLVEMSARWLRFPGRVGVPPAAPGILPGASAVASLPGPDARGETPRRGGRDAHSTRETDASTILRIGVPGSV